MTNRFDGADHDDEDLSALADGELGPAAVARLCGEWRNELGMRERWHQYHLIGDVLRSEDLAAMPAHDNDFLVALRGRLVSEPIVMAPLAAVARPDAVRSAPPGRRRVVAFGAIAAGFVVVAAGVLTILGQPIAGSSSAAPAVGTLAQTAPAIVVAARSPVRADSVSELQPTIASGQLIRDAKLDSYLSAHRQWSEGAVLGGHAAYLRYNPGDGATR